MRLSAEEECDEPQKSTCLGEVKHVNSNCTPNIVQDKNCYFCFVKRGVVHTAPIGVEAFQSLPEGTLAELIDNVVYMSPSPATRHQKIAQKIFRRLSEQIEDTGMGEVFMAPLDVYLDEHSNAVQPDIVVVLKSSAHIINPEGHIHGVPDVLVEVLSPASKEYDLDKKRDLYERFRVKEYWVVDPLTKGTWYFRLTENKFYQLPSEPGIIESQVLQTQLVF